MSHPQQEPCDGNASEHRLPVSPRLQSPYRDFVSPGREFIHFDEEEDNRATISRGLNKAASRRVKRGECPACGAKLFKNSMLGKKKTPLTIPGQSLNGRCLFCFPIVREIVGSHLDRYPDEPGKAVVPRFLSVPTDDTPDDGTVMSTITLDHHLGQFAQEGEKVAPPPRLPPPTYPPQQASQSDHMRWPPGTDRSTAPVLTPPASSRRRRSSFDNDEADENDRGPALPCRSVSPSRFSELDPLNSEVRANPMVAPLRRASNNFATFMDHDPQHESNSIQPRRVQPSSARARVEWDGYPLTVQSHQHSGGCLFPSPHPRPFWKGQPQTIQTSKEADDEKEEKSEIQSPAHAHDPPWQPSELKPKGSPREIVFDSSRSPYDPPEPASVNYNTLWQQMSKSTPIAHEEIVVDPNTLPLDDGNASALKQERKPIVDSADHRVRNGSDPGWEYSMASFAYHQDSISFQNSSFSFLSHTKSTSPQSATQTSPNLELAVSLEDILPLVKTLRDDVPNTHESALRHLTATVWQCGNLARQAVIEAGGIPVWTMIVWQDMNDEAIQVAALDLIFAVAIGDCIDATYDYLANDTFDYAVDALLIMMQSLIHNEDVQTFGCRVLACLAGASGRNATVNDGALSGAVLTVLRAIDSHKHSLSLREWGIRALYQQCALSKDMNSNRKALVEAKLDHNTSGLDVISYCLDEVGSNAVMAEWICNLYWCLSSSQEIAQIQVPATEPLLEMTNIVRKYQKSRGSVLLLQAALAAISNLCMLAENRKGLDTTEVVLLALEVLDFHQGCSSVAVEVCGLIASLLPTVRSTECIPAGSIQTLCSILEFPRDLKMNREALRALNAVLASSTLARKRLWETTSLSWLTEVSRLHCNSVEWQALSCVMLSNLLIANELDTGETEKWILSELYLIISRCTDALKVQEVGISILSKISKDETLSTLLDEESLKLVVDMMSKFPLSKIIQRKGSFLILNVARGPIILKHLSVAERCASSLVITLQNHLETSDIIGFACDAIWVLIHGSDMLKETVVTQGGIDALSCALVLHQNEVSILEKACGVLSCLSSRESHIQTVVNAQSVFNVVDAMRNNPNSASLTQYGCLLLKNVIVTSREQSILASGAISVVTAAMLKHPHESGMQREACSFLWAITSASGDCKSKVLALDAVSLLMTALSSDKKDVQDAARGAFNTIALTSNESLSAV